MNAVSNKPVVKPKQGNESFVADGKQLDFSLNDFWRWNVSDLLNNLTRGHLAEFIVAKALHIKSDVRDEWAAFDLEKEGTKIEVKAAAYIQTWTQHNFSKIKFEVCKTKEWDWDKHGYRDPAKRHAHIYIFALFAYKDEEALKNKESVNPLDLDKWSFFLVPTTVLDDLDQNSISLEALQKMEDKKYKPVTFLGLEEAFEQLATNVRGLL